MTPPPRHFRPRACLLATALLALSSASLAAAPAAPGDLLSAAPYRASWVPSKAAHAYKLYYRTPDHRGQLAEGTGLLYLPAGTAPAGGWPVVSWAHGTQGIADRCAPSVSGPYQPARDGRFLDQFLAQGYAVVAADYQGLGSPGSHAYLHVRTAARNAIDMIKASRQYLGNGTLSPRWVSVGHSQGGAAALTAGHIAPSYGGPSLQYRGSFTTGTPTAVELTALVMKPDNRAANPGALNAYHAYLLDGLLQAAPQIDRVLSDEGRARVAVAREQCLGELAVTLDGADTGSMFTAPLTHVPGIWAVLYDYLGVPRRGFSQPLMLGHGSEDRDVPYLTTLLYAAGLALRGEPVAFRRYPVDHRGTLDAAAADGLAFVRARFEDGHFSDTAETAGIEQLLDEVP
ncbi:lipase family protein [Stenotrophomonas maltophilia group sp. msm1]|uniref:lipase family protein n=1 Tax=Stenotrophomonas maltophilia group sp. msm1 TaxID=3061099 RepID=UPI002895C117|nr:lipase family protein [Stenotrophomonas maltophilia group sp. msm1]MDT3558485.1 lipase family protein [Stenotrophomonas maltophilia group sp. msm1]